ncbi:NADP-dependent oxidoreductase domain-containing protein [Hygrophoropsis aurantiaca]|uniref:NADP-dependent oxidoreductase domain-containing protein n=1 Tax=Hygrophoropsis aurantiaca TaxID=72124 RepID=A0ACB8ARV2_9AGAM|nr:NADP-dependent oxidoreductase domain-containing protein [Hygrophoropsis aurantiaca]
MADNLESSIMATRIPLIFGTMTMGSPGKNGVRTYNQSDCQGIIDVFLDHTHTELDTARGYGEGTTEQMLATLDLRDASIDTKVPPRPPGNHAPEALRAAFLKSLQTLKRDKVRVLYLHAPDRSVPFEDTAREMNELYKEGKFENFGLSNFAAWEVAEIVTVCKANGWVQPKIYQVMYNAITRDMETELVPCCRKFGIRIVIYNPLAGGLFAGKITSAEDLVSDGSRFDARTTQGANYRARYLKDGYFKALELIKSVAEEHGIRTTEIALRWCQHHSVLREEDGIIIGASSAAQLEDNCSDSAKGPLPDEVLQALDEANRIVKAHGSAPKYFR